jgi:hypothetical protein
MHVDARLAGCIGAQHLDVARIGLEGVQRRVREAAREVERGDADVGADVEHHAHLRGIEARLRGQRIFGFLLPQQDAVDERGVGGAGAVMHRHAVPAVGARRGRGVRREVVAREGRRARAQPDLRPLLQARHGLVRQASSTPTSPQ